MIANLKTSPYAIHPVLNTETQCSSKGSLQLTNQYINSPRYSVGYRPSEEIGEFGHDSGKI